MITLPLPISSHRVTLLLITSAEAFARTGGLFAWGPRLPDFPRVGERSECQTYEGFNFIKCDIMPQ